VNIAETIRKTIELHNLIPVGAQVVAGVSGGGDSVALVHALHQLGTPFMVAHLNHNLRGTESDADEAFVRQLAEKLKVPFVGRSVDVKAQSETSGLSIEMAARQARHDFFAEFNDAVIALAHHADDQVETFMLKLSRGAGAEGLGGMPYSQKIGPIRLIRPMLDILHADILQWLKANGFDWREDATNTDETFLRNRIRHTVLPLLEKELNPNIRETILRTMDILRAENQWAESIIAKAKLEDLPSLPLAARRRVLRKWLFKNNADGVDFDAVDKILSLMENAKGTACFELNERQRIVVEYGQLRFEEGAPRPIQPEWEVVIEPGTGWKKDHGRGAGILPAEASFDAEKVGHTPIKVRPVQPGDRIRPLGMEGSRKLQDIFTDLKIPRAKRSAIPVVVCRGEIIWLPGYRIARGWAVPSASAKAVHIRIEQKNTG